MSDSSTRPSSRSRRARPPRWRSLVVVVSAALALGVYLFVTAPAPLDARPGNAPTIPIRTVFAMLELENDAARAMWTEEIVHGGTAQGLAFSEAWRDDTVHAGPLPALFLRETARNLERTPLQLSLFLGSQFPINAANQLTGQQARRFATLEENGAPQFFYEPATHRQTAMFADRAVSEACVRCHNEHPNSPKHDWEPRAIMGATTWMYPDAAVTAERAVEMIAALRASIRAAYTSYLDKVGTFANQPAIGDRWPKDGFYLPSADVFMRELARRTSTTTLQGLIEPGWAEAAATLEPPPPPPARIAPPTTRPPSDAAPMLVIRSAHPTKVTIDRAGSRLLLARLPAGGSTALSSRPPLRVELSDREGVEVEYAGKPLVVPATPDDVTSTDDVELVLGPPPPPGKS